MKARVQMSIRTILIAVCFMSNSAFGQTTRTGPSASSTTATIPSSSSTSPNTPCSSFNPTSPCYTARIPRNPCYSAVAPDQPCSVATTPYPQAPPTPTPPESKTVKSAAAVHVFTQDQANAKIEAQGYSNVSALRRDARGNWRGKAEKDGLLRNITLDGEGKVTEN